MLTMEDEPWLSRVGFKAARLDLLRGVLPPAAIATALAEGLRKRVERLGVILSLQENSENTHQILPKQNYNNENKRLTEPVMGRTNISGKESLSDKQSPQQFPTDAKINLKWTNPCYNNGDKSPVIRVDESALRQWKKAQQRKQWTNP